MRHILGISAFYHDSAACLIRDGEIIAAAQEERFTRKKHDPGFPAHAISYCLKEGNITLRELRYIVFYDKPLVKFERLLETYLAFAPKGLQSFVAAMPVWLKEKLFLRNLLANEFMALTQTTRKSEPCRCCLASTMNHMRLQRIIRHLMTKLLFSAWMASESGPQPLRGWVTEIPLLRCGKFPFRILWGFSIRLLRTTQGSRSIRENIR